MANVYPADPCPDRPQVPPEPKPWTGEVKVHNTMTVRINEDDTKTNADAAKAFAQGVVVGCVIQASTYVDIDIHETEAFRDGE